MLILSKIPKSIATEPQQENTFTLYNHDGETYQPIEGTKFIITDLEGNFATDSNGEFLGTPENIAGKDYYVFTTDTEGNIKINLPKGIYKAIQIQLPDAYILEEQEEDRTYYFEIGLKEFNITEWIKGLQGYSWQNMQKVISKEEGGITVIGHISEYSPEIAGDFYNGVDLNTDTIIEETAKGNLDGIIISYDKTGNYLWSETIGGIYNDICTDILQTKDGGYIVAGYVESSTIFLNEKTIPELSKSNKNLKNKDGYILKINSQGEYEWGTRIGGNLDDKIEKVIETKEGNIIIAGNFNSSNLQFYESNVSNIVLETIENDGEENSFIASYSKDGKYQWSKKIGGQAEIQLSDIACTENSLTVIINFKGTIKLGENYLISSKYTENLDGIILNYDLKGKIKWHYHLRSEAINIYTDLKYIRLTAIDTTSENNLLVAIACTDTVEGSNNIEKEYKNIYSVTKSGIMTNISMFSEEGEFIKNIYNLGGEVTGSSSRDAAVIFKDITLTKEQDILLGGYYYSTKKIDVDKDGASDGEYDFISSSQLNPNGFILKIDLDGKTKYSNCMYRNERETYSQSEITAIDETSEGEIIAVGNFWGNSLTTKKFYNTYIKDQQNEPYYLNKKGAINGFILKDAANNNELEILEHKNIEVKNLKKKYIITSEIKTHLQTDKEGNEIWVKGGNITGVYNQTIDGITYTENGKHYVETVKYGENSTKEIIITPEEGYKIKQILINNEKYTNFTADEQGIIKIPIFSNITSNQHIVVTFCKKITNVLELPNTGSNSKKKLKILGISLIIIGVCIIKRKNQKTR